LFQDDHLLTDRDLVHVGSADPARIDRQRGLRLAAGACVRATVVVDPTGKQQGTQLLILASSTASDATSLIIRSSTTSTTAALDTLPACLRQSYSLVANVTRSHSSNTTLSLCNRHQHESLEILRLGVTSLFLPT
jgi:hypothetical protein